MAEHRNYKMMNLTAMGNYLRPQDVPEVVSARILAFLNAAEMTQEIMKHAVLSNGSKVISNRVAQNILDSKVRLCGFKNLEQVACVPRIGTKTFTGMVQALNNRL